MRIFFDPVKLRSNMLASEAKVAPPEQLQRAEKIYDNTYRLVTDKLRNAEEYCTEPATRAIKADLQRHLSGDYTPPVQKEKAADDGWFSSVPSNKVEPLDREKIFDPGPRARS